MKTTYVAIPVDLKIAAPRFNNYRPYLVGGFSAMYDMTSGKGDMLRTQPLQAFVQIGLGCDFYLPFFKIRPELKFMYSLVNSLDTKHINRMEDKGMLPYARSVSDARAKLIVLTFYFE